MNRTRVLLAVLALVVVAFVFQVFLRYTYLHEGARLVRIDRLTQHACLVSLGSRPPPPSQTPNPNPFLSPGPISVDEMFPDKSGDCN